MNNNNEIKYDFDDITIIPEYLSTIKSRSEVSPFFGFESKLYLPLIVAPMDTVLDSKNYLEFEKNKILTCLPRGSNDVINYERFVSISLDEAKILVHEPYTYFDSIYYCIDVANGHMKDLYDTVKLLTEKKPNIKLIVGNIANPETYKLYADLGVWGVRAGIGGGGACTTSSNLSIHYPMGSLIHEIREIKKKFNYQTYIIADGGMRKYSDIIKALGLGADIVMIGSLFNKSLQSCSKSYLWKTFKVSGKIEKWLFDHKFPLHKKFRGMSTKEVQKLWGKKKLTTSEGIIKWNEVLYDLPKWVENFEDYLRSAMSYTSSKNLDDFKDSSKILISANAYRRFNK